MKYRFHHCHVICSDLDEMIGFFTGSLGAELIAKKKFGPSDGAMLDLSGTKINLRVAREEEGSPADSSEVRYGYDHIGVEVDDLDGAYRDLTAKGFSFTVTPRVFEDLKIAFFKGPDNITVELIQPPA
jgi:catechol 2,3-dioxygenase-like lactoylglutathione lyase family enzyme